MPLRATKRIPIADDPGHFVVVRMPTLNDLEEAQTVGFKRQMARGIPAAEIGTAIDVTTVLQRCIVEWSYPDPLTPEAVSELDAMKATQIYTDLQRGDSEEDQKKAS